MPPAAVLQLLFAVCLIVTAFVIAPMSVAILGGSVAKLLMSMVSIEYILKNIGLLNLAQEVGGRSLGVAFAS